MSKVFEFCSSPLAEVTVFAGVMAATHFVVLALGVLL